MTGARRLAHCRLVAAGLAVALPLFLPLAARRLMPGVAGLTVAVGFLTLLAGAGAFFFFVFRWRPRCPQCAVARASFVRAPDEDEYLVCPSCGFREATGYTWRN